eukprot:760534_1
MSRLQEHFLEKLAYENEQRRIRETELKTFAFQTTISDTDFSHFTETDNYTTNYDDSEIDIEAPTTPKSIISSTSRSSVTSPLNTFAYPDDSSNPFQLPPRTRNGSTKSNESFKSKNSNNKNNNKIKGKSNVAIKATFFNNPTLTTNNLNKHNMANNNNNNNNNNKIAKTATSMIKSSAAIGPTIQKSSRPHTPSNKMKYCRKPRGYSDAPTIQKRNKTIASGLSKLKGLKQSISNPSSPHGRSVTLMTPQASAGAYRLDLFCDIKFVKKIFVRWISCKNEVL